MSRRYITLPVALLAGALWAGTAHAQAARQSWTSDRRDFAAGDVITVLIDEYTLASSNQGDFNSDRRFQDLSVGASQSILAGLPGGGADISTANQAESRRRGEASRQNRFQGEITVRVLSIEEGGLLKVEGRKVVNIDKTSEELVLTGFIRPQDVSDRNMIDSWRINNPEMIYTTRGGSPKKGIIGRILGMLWP